MDNLEGRDIGRIKKEGYYFGTKAFSVRLKVVVGALTVSTLLGALLLFTKNQGTITKRVLKMQEDLDERERRIRAIAAKRLEIEKKMEEESPKTVS